MTSDRKREITAAVVQDNAQAWPGLIAGLSDGELSELSGEATSQAVHLAQFARYCDARGGAGCGDRNGTPAEAHIAAVRYARKNEKSIRRALGYSYP